MICAPCREAADRVTMFVTAYATGIAYETLPEIVREAELQHAECKGCDCQHNVAAQVAGKVLRR